MRQMHAIVDDVHELGALGYDLIVQVGRVMRKVEVKDGSKPPAHRKLTANELAARAESGDCYAVVISVDEAVELVHEMRRENEKPV